MAGPCFRWGLWGATSGWERVTVSEKPPAATPLTQQRLIIRKSTRYQNSLEVWDVMLDNNAKWTSQRHRSVKLAWQPGKRVFYEEWLMKTWRVTGRLSPHCSCLISLVNDCSEIMVPLHTVIAVSSGRRKLLPFKHWQCSLFHTAKSSWVINSMQTRITELCI